MAGGLRGIVPLSQSVHIRMEGFYFQPLKEILVGTDNVPYYSEKLFAPYQFVGCGGLVYHTPFGPASLLVNYFSNSDPKFYLQASFGFLIFNRHAN